MRGAREHHGPHRKLQELSRRNRVSRRGDHPIPLRSFNFGHDNAPTLPCLASLTGCDLFAQSYDVRPTLPRLCRRMRAFRSSACSLRTCTLSTRELRPCESLAVLFPSLFLPAQAPAPSTHPPSFTLIIVRLTDCCFFAPPQPP